MVYKVATYIFNILNICVQYKPYMPNKTKCICAKIKYMCAYIKCFSANMEWMCANSKCMCVRYRTVCARYPMGCQDMPGVSQAIRYRFVYLRYAVTADSLAYSHVHSRGSALRLWANARS
jgi:hypothetical protein